MEINNVQLERGSFNSWFCKSNDKQISSAYCICTSKHFSYINPFNLTTVLHGRFYCHAHLSDEGTEPLHKEQKSFVPGHTARKWQSRV